MKLDRVTFTGADDSIDPSDLIPISEAYPFVEWGILKMDFSGYSTRFPSQDWIDQLVEVAPASMNLCLHLCGSPVLRVFSRGEFNYSPKFKRSQLNFHGSSILKHFPDAGNTLQKITSAREGFSFILQCDGVNDRYVKELAYASNSITPLFDTSSGAGVTPSFFGESWPKLWEGIYCGYAGGLGPNNLPDELVNHIQPAVDKVDLNGRIWIDMETKVFTKGQFDLGKCVQVLESVKEYVTT